MKKIITHSISGIKSIVFYNELTTGDEKIDPVCKPSINSQGYFCLYNKDSAQRSIRPGFIRKINGSPDPSGFVEGEED